METVDENRLIQYLEGALSKDEMSAVESWLSAAPENQRILDQVYYTLQVAERLHVMKSVDTEKALNGFKSRMNAQNKRNQIRRFIHRMERIAAILFIPVLFLSAYWLLPKGENGVQLIEVRTNPGVVSSFDLPDGTKVWLNANSKLIYPSAFVGDRRTVELEGQGYFEVSKHPDKPFIVSTDPYYSVEVLGTSFNISAYKEDEQIETTLVEGSVQLNIICNNELVLRKIKPNEKAELKRLTKELHIRPVETDYDTAWRNGEIIFRRLPMEEVLKVLSRHYHVKFDVKSPQVLTSIITAKFKNEQLPQVMEYLKLASDIKYKINKPVINGDNTTETQVIEISK